jgi:Tfp pilus assembly protein FimT
MQLYSRLCTFFEFRSSSCLGIVRRHFTLMEILVVLSLIALISGVVGINIHKVFVDQRFRNEMSLIVDQLRLAQDLMLILDTDLHLIFAEDKKEQGNAIWIEGETRLPVDVQKEIDRKRATLKTIKGIFFHDELGGEIKKGRIDIKFLSKGAVMSKGLMRLATSNEENPSSNVLQNFICLSGYIQPIFSFETKEAAAAACDSKKNEDFDKQLTQDTFSRLPEKLLSTSEADSQEQENSEKANNEAVDQKQQKNRSNEQ